MNKEKEIQPVEENQVEENKKFPSVVTTSSLFGVDEGTVLKFDFDAGKYVSVTESEDIGPGESYFYSGSAIALDPYLVKRSMDNNFVYLEHESNPELEVEGTSTTTTNKKPEPEVWDVADLVVRCDQCGSITRIDTVKRGVQFIMSTTSESTIELVCPDCKSKMSLLYENGRMFTEEELNENEKEPKLKVDTELKENENESQEESTE